jgi:hypothetical protein
LADSGLELSRVEKKTWKKKPGVTRRVDLARPNKKPGYNPLTFYFLLKRRRFDFFKTIDRDNPVKTRNPGLGPGQV